jgi:hypothetical protein
MLTYAHVCSRMLTYAPQDTRCWLASTARCLYSDVCSRMLTYAHVCSRMLRRIRGVGWRQLRDASGSVRSRAAASHVSIRERMT